MDILQRLQEIQKFSGLSLRAFAIKCGISQPTLDKQIKGLRAVSLETIMSILYAFSEVSAEWLMRGKGQMLLQSDVNSAESDRANKLVDTIATLQEAINSKNETIAILTDKVRQLEKSK